MLRIWSLTILCLAFATGEVLPAPGAMPMQNPLETRAQSGAGPGAPVVLAQSGEGGLFRSLFGRRKNNRSEREIREKADEIRRNTRRKQQQRPRRSEPRTTVVRKRPAAPAHVVTEKTDDAKRVLVVGGFMATALAKGLSDAFADNPDVVFVNASNPASGLVRDDYYDWIGETPKLVTENKASMVLVMVGGNDRQPIRAAGGQIPVNSDAWRAGYEAKVAGLADMLAAQNIPVVWLSLVPVSSDSLSRDYSTFNSLYRQKAELKGMTFIDVWNGFADDKGGYEATGPDINGQTRSLRTDDGLNFTRAGRRKLAFFVEREVTRFLEGAQAPVFAGLGPGPNGLSPEDAPALPAISPMVPIEAISLRPGSNLSTAPDRIAEQIAESDVAAKAEETKTGEPEKDQPAPAKVPKAPSGRADNFTWPPPQ